ncbi:prepilin peptidase [Enterobacter kobei]|uniref:prepilin peptidase n=1 Tax=Enterobacter kobei TaxID=208224 RepID=UPI003CEC6B73
MLFIYMIAGLFSGSALRIIINQLPLSILNQVDDIATLNERKKHLCENSVLIPVSIKAASKNLRQSIFAARQNPSLEIINSLLYGTVFMLWPETEKAIPLCFLGSSMIVLALIDYRYLLLPDAITQPALWAGILWNSSGSGFVTLSDAVWGTVAGYMILWITNVLFFAFTGRRGLGQGDYKLLAMFGAWSGTANVTCVLTIAPAIAFHFWLLNRPVNYTNLIPFGPSLVIAEAISIFVNHTDILGYGIEVFS